MKIKLLLALSVALLVSSCWKKDNVRTFVRPVQVGEVQSLASYQKDFVGVVTASEYTNLAFRVGGQITKVYVNDGTNVSKGQVLAELDPSDVELQLAADKSNFQTRKSILERSERLLERGAISVQEVEIARANLQSAKSAYEYSQNQFAYTKLRSPFSGSVEKKYVEQYQRVNAGEKIFKIINPNLLEVSFTLPESDANFVMAKGLIFIEFENYPGDKFSAKVKEMVDASVGGAGIPVTISITDKQFSPSKYLVKAGFACRVSVVIENQDSIRDYVTVPVTAIFADSDSATKKYVWVYDAQNSTVIKREVVTAGLTGTNAVVIRSGVTAGERVVTAGVYQLIDNQKVKLIQ